MRIATVFILGLLLTFYFGSFSTRSSQQVLTVNGVGRLYYQGWPAYFLEELDENVDLGNRTLYLRSTSFYPIFFLLDWLICTTAILIAVNVYTYGKKQWTKSPLTQEQKLTVKSRRCYFAALTFILIGIIYLTMGMFVHPVLLLCGVDSLVASLIVGKESKLIKREIDALKISQLKSERRVFPIEKD